ncbi:MAG TPA: peptidyl-alpha-hydroxyglycine alpha-amidating lyase family protein [Micropepsaceae bacterium]|nr:peptidyl-alpha-hydroxyglycine alpha-amidating lyase family protein [Micropepsaceae bacterium]
MRTTLTALAIALLGTAGFGDAAIAEDAPCVNDAPNPYRLVNDWAHMPRAWAPTNNVYVDGKDNVWVMDRCEDKGCLNSANSPIWEMSADGKVLKNFGAGMFAFPHTVKPDGQGNIWAIDGDARGGKGDQVFKFSPGGKLLLTLGKAGQAGTGTDVFDRPTGIAFAPNGDIFISEGHAPGFGNSRIMKFDSNGKFIKSFGHLGSGEGELKGPHVLAFDSQGRLFVADRSNSRIDIFNQDGKFLAAWRQFGRPSGIFIGRNDVLYVSDSESETAPGKDTNNPGCKRGIRVGSARTGKVDYYIPPPPVSDPKFPPPEGVAADSRGNIYAAAVPAKSVYKYVRNGD